MSSLPTLVGLLQAATRAGSLTLLKSRHPLLLMYVITFNNKSISLTTEPVAINFDSNQNSILVYKLYYRIYDVLFQPIKLHLFIKYFFI